MSVSGGYEADFVSPPAEIREYTCPICLFVAREPCVSSCCGQHFCQSCINEVLAQRGSCPLCKVASFTVMLNRHHRGKIQALKVRCPMKKRGCVWIGELEKLDAHTDEIRSGSCQFVYVSCPNNCGDRQQRRHLDRHILDSCPKRPFTCKYCGFKSTHDDVCNRHYSSCVKFPVPCPNKCKTQSVERGKVKEHLSECPQQLVDCEFVHVGCIEKVKRKNLPKHLELNIHTHLLLVSASSKAQTDELRDVMQRQHTHLLLVSDSSKAQTDDLRDVMQRQLGDLRREKNRQLEEKDHWMRMEVERLESEKDRQLEALRRDMQKGEGALVLELKSRLERLERRAGIAPHIEFVQPGYRFQMKRKGAHSKREEDPGPGFYMQPEKVKLQIYFCYEESALHIELYQLPGEFDDEVNWPVTCKVDIQLLNLLSTYDHIDSKSHIVTLTRRNRMWFIGRTVSVNYATIENPMSGVQYLQDGCLRCRVYVIVK